MEQSAVLRKPSFAETLRGDTWWIEPLLVLMGLSAFIIYATWAAFQANHYFAISYLSPFYSPVIYTDTSVVGSAPVWHALLGTWPEWWPSFLPASPAFLILVFPGLFRFTCYYYRGAYYKAFAATPPACAVSGIPQKNYQGETFLLIFQNLHRYALYAAIVYLFILAADSIAAYFYQGQLGIGVGSVVLSMNPVLLGAYTLGCHSFRHLIGGRKDCFSCAGAGPLKNGVYQKVSWLNRNHKLFAWMSLFWVGISDAYVRLVSMGIITDLNTWGL